MEFDHPRYAVLADIHGNRWALEAVLADVGRRGITRCVNLGDSLYGPLDPAGTADLLRERRDPTVLGNEDRILLAAGGSGDAHPTLRFTREQIDSRTLRWIATLPRSLSLTRDILLCHGTPEHDDRYLLQEVRAGVPVGRSPSVLDELLAEVSARIILCGHDHTPAAVRTPSGRQIFNPGSVGLPAYVDEQPARHAMGTGSPHARYGVLIRSDGNWHFEQLAVAYDWTAAAETAKRNGREDWAYWLATGRAEED